MIRLLRALHTRPFALFWSGQTLSRLGDHIFQVALAWWVLEKTGSPIAMGTVFIVSIIPMLTFLLVGGVMVDRFQRLYLMLISDSVRCVLMAILAFLAFTDVLAIWHIYVSSLISGFVSAFFQPAYTAAVAETVPPDDLTSANSLSSLSTEIVGIVGPTVGAAAIALGGVTLAFALNSFSFLVPVVCLLPVLNVSGKPGDSDRVGGIWADLREGLLAVRNTPWLWVTISVAGLSNIAYAGPMEVLLPFLIKEYHQADVRVFGLFYSATALGSVAAAVWLGRLPRLRRRGLTLYGAWMTIGVLVMVIGLPIPTPAILIAALTIGLCNTTLSLAWVNALQDHVPRHLLGRVRSVDYLGSSILLPVGYAAGGWASALIGAPLVFVIGGFAQTLLIALGLLHPKVRSLD